MERKLLVRKVVVGGEKIVERWSVLVDDGKGKASEVLGETLRFIEEYGLPDVKVEKVDLIARHPLETSLAARLWKGSKAREFLMVTNENEWLKDFKMYIGAKDYGNSLGVSWYLTCEPGFMKRLFSTVLFHGKTKEIRRVTPDKALSFALDIFSQQDLIAYVTCVHHSLLKAVEKIMRELGQDPSKIDRKSKGFLGVS